MIFFSCEFLSYFFFFLEKYFLSKIQEIITLRSKYAVKQICFSLEFLWKVDLKKGEVKEKDGEGELLLFWAFEEIFLKL